MLPAERRKYILELVKNRNSISVAELSQLLKVSEMTVRRDLRMLSHIGLLERVHGGALLRTPGSYEPPYLLRLSEHKREKETIGRCAAQLVQEGDSIVLDVGTTTLELAKALLNKNNLTVMTASLHIANVIRDSMNIRLILAGGILRAQEQSMIGLIPERSFSDFHVDKAFIAVGGLDLQAGLTEYDLEDALVKKTIIQNAGQVILVADSHKLGQVCFVSIAPISVVDILVTDASADGKFVDHLRKLGIEVIIAG